MSALILAAALPVRADDDSWQFSIKPYIWFPAVDATIGEENLPRDVELDSDASEVFDKLDLPILICGEVQKGRFGLVYDLQYLKFSDSRTAGVNDRRELDADLTFFDATVALEYRIVDQPKQFSIDALGGARVVYAATEVDFSAAGPLPDFGVDRDRTWVDPIIGLKARWTLGERWSLGAYGDIGGFSVGSDLTYQVMGVIAFQFNDHVALTAGYRYFSVDYDDDGFAFDAQIHGPIVGLTFSF